MARAGIMLTAAMGLWLPLAVAQEWFDLREKQDPVGDLSDEHREALKRLDPGVQGSQTAVGSAVVDEAKLLREHGSEWADTVTVWADPASAGRAAGVEILNSTPVDISGDSVVQTDNGPMTLPMWAVRSAWRLEDRPRRIALMVMEMQEDYRHYIGFLTPKIAPILREFRSQSLPVFFTTWVRRPADGLYGAGDRAAGVQGLKDEMNGNFIYSENGTHPMKELFPTPDELESGNLIKSIHANKFADLDRYGREILSKKIRDLGVDTIVLTGGWSDICILATAMDAMDTKNLDVLIVSDGVATTTANQKGVFGVLNNLFTLMNSSSLVDYLQTHRGDSSYLLKKEDRRREFLLKDDAGPQLSPHAAAASAFWIVGAVLSCTVLVAISVYGVYGLQRRWRSIGSEPAYTQQPCAGNV